MGQIHRCDQVFEEVALIGKNTLKWLVFFQFTPGSNLSFPCRDYTSQTCLNLFDFSEWSSGTKSLVGSKSSLLCPFQSFAGGRKEGRRKGKGKGKERERKEKGNRDTRHLALGQASFLEFHYLPTQSPFFSPTNMASIQEAFPSRDLLLSG